MPAWLAVLLYLIAFVCFIIAAFAHTRPISSRANLVALGLAAWVLVPLINAFDALD